MTRLEAIAEGKEKSIFNINRSVYVLRKRSFYRVASRNDAVLCMIEDGYSYYKMFYNGEEKPVIPVLI